MTSVKVISSVRAEQFNKDLQTALQDQGWRLIQPVETIRYRQAGVMYIAVVGRLPANEFI